eukprot:TRINITY_DN27917_c0_g1_i1.p1 TRINITY_DN27917_c0_g1~~TRINITY_DN27917_c0_g1_i1.p1  ORF type:complete len:224 (+),score=44.34 TRINITY_DN27917_c0_g1_i1:38-673(+)
MYSALRSARRHGGARCLSRTAVKYDPGYKHNEWQADKMTTDTGRYLINSDTTLYDFMIYTFQLNRFYCTVESRVANLLEYTTKNVGMVSMRSRAFNYSLYYYFPVIHKAASNLLFNYKIQPLMMHKVHHLIQYFHAAQTNQHKAIIRKPANFKYFWLWWWTRINRGSPLFQYDKEVYARQCANGEVKLPPMKRKAEGWRALYLNAFEGGQK